MMKKNLYITGVGGWLGFLVLRLMVLDPIVGFYGLSKFARDAIEQSPRLAYYDQWQNYKQTALLIFVVSAAVSISSGYRLWKIHIPESVKFTLFALWLVGPLNAILHLATISIVFKDSAFSYNILPFLIGIIISLVVAGIWSAYLLRSVRVKNTYYSLPAR
jgi:hypothetical protein